MYIPKCNGKVERFNRMILSTIRHYICDLPHQWDSFKNALTYAYKTQAHRRTKRAPFELVLSKARNHFSI